MENDQLVSQPPQQDEQEQITPEILERFKLISLQTKDIMEGFSQQTKLFSQAVGDFTKQMTPDTSQMVPAEKIQEFMKYYQNEMKNVNLEAATLEAILKEEEEERNQLEAEMDVMFEKLDRLEQTLKLKKAKKGQEEPQTKEQIQAQKQQQELFKK